MIKKQAEDLTKAYIHSYNLAMEEVRNPGFATQVALGVTTSIAMATPKRNVAVVDPFEVILAHMGVVKQEEAARADSDGQGEGGNVHNG